MSQRYLCRNTYSLFAFPGASAAVDRILIGRPRHGTATARALTCLRSDALRAPPLCFQWLNSQTRHVSVWYPVAFCMVYACNDHSTSHSEAEFCISIINMIDFPWSWELCGPKGKSCVLPACTKSA